MTFEILDPTEDDRKHDLRIVPPAELHADTLIEEAATPRESEADDTLPFDENGLFGDGSLLMRTNQETVDDPASQRLTMEDIEALKARNQGTRKDIIAKLLQSHSALDQKTAFSLAKYTLRKNKKYIKRFTVLPLDVPILTQWMLADKDAVKIMELRNEVLGLIGCWANVHSSQEMEHGALQSGPSGRWLVVDETGGLVVAAVAERIGVLCPSNDNDLPSDPVSLHTNDFEPQAANATSQSHRPRDRLLGMSATHNTITLLHANSQPNLALLKYFSFDLNNPSILHPLRTHLKTLSWLQLLDPDTDPAYAEPEAVPEDQIFDWKSTKKSNYYRKRRRWERIKGVIDETRDGGFDGLIVASFMNPTTILQHAVPLLKGAAQVVVYSPHIEPLVELADIYSTARRAAFIGSGLGHENLPTEDFPVDPTLLLAPTVQTARVRPWQALPGRTHPLMIGRGGADGYVFHATRVIPAEGKVEARGAVSKRRKVESGTAVTTEVGKIDVLECFTTEATTDRP